MALLQFCTFGMFTNDVTTSLWTILIEYFKENYLYFILHNNFN